MTVDKYTKEDVVEIGKVYRPVPTEIKCDKCGHESEPKPTRFPFNAQYGMFLGVCPSGFLRFKLQGRKEALMNGGSYEEVEKDLVFQDQ